MPIIILLTVLSILFVFMVVISLKKSPKFDNFVKDITEPVDVTPKTADVVIKDISAAEKALHKEAEAKKVEAEKLRKESAKIGDYLAEKGVVKPEDKRKGADDK